MLFKNDLNKLKKVIYVFIKIHTFNRNSFKFLNFFKLDFKNTLNYAYFYED